MCYNKKTDRNMKVKLNDSNLWKDYLTFLGYLSIIIGFAAIFITIPDKDKCSYGLYFFLFLLLAYLIMLLRANLIDSLTLDIRGKKVNIQYGDIFKSKGLKLIPFNEYYDTVVDDKIIAKKSLNGIFIEKHCLNVSSLDSQISNALISKNGNLNQTRSKGKNTFYPIGTTIEVDNEFILAAFTHFDKNDNAYLNKGEYLFFLDNLWEEINIIYAARNINIPLIGSGITRLGGNLTMQDHLEQILNSIKFSDIKMAQGSHINIVLHRNVKNEINLYRIKSNYK